MKELHTNQTIDLPSSDDEMSPGLLEILGEDLLLDVLEAVLPFLDILLL